VFALTSVRESALVDFSGPSPVVRASSPVRAEQEQARSNVDLAAYVHEDPFAQTDLPVDLREDRETSGE